jgi:hypothetical protein
MAEAKSPSLAFAMERLKKNPNAVFADLKKDAEKRGLKMVPIVFGRAKLALGLAKKKPKVAVAKVPGTRASASSAKVKLGALPAGLGSSVLNQIEGLARDAQTYRAAVEEIRAILNRLP